MRRTDCKWTSAEIASTMNLGLADVRVMDRDRFNGSAVTCCETTDGHTIIERRVVAHDETAVRSIF